MLLKISWSKYICGQISEASLTSYFIFIVNWNVVIHEYLIFYILKWAYTMQSIWNWSVTKILSNEERWRITEMLRQLLVMVMQHNIYVISPPIPYYIPHSHNLRKLQHCWKHWLVIILIFVAFILRHRKKTRSSSLTVNPLWNSPRWQVYKAPHCCLWRPKMTKRMTATMLFMLILNGGL